MQLLLTHKAALAYNRGDYQLAYSYALDGIKISHPHFDEHKVETYIYTSIEIQLVNTIAAAQIFNKSLDASTEIYMKLKNSVDRNYAADKSKQKKYLLLLYNITHNLGLLKKYQDCIPLCNQGIELSKIDRNLQFPI